MRVLVLTYNRTLRGYVEELVRQQLEIERVDLKLTTFGKWARELLGAPDVIDGRPRADKLWQLGVGLGYPYEFLADEVDYALGRYMPDRIIEYYGDAQHPNYKRRGRGEAPRVDRGQRARLVGEVISPYQDWKAACGRLDWADVAIKMAQRSVRPEERWDIVVIDEAQDFSANQIRGVMRHLQPEHSTTFVIDALQRVYPRGFGWPEVDVELTHSYRLTKNHRNTKQIAAFALPLVADLPREDDGTLPDFRSCDEDGAVPMVVRGAFRSQMAWVIDHIRGLPEGESIALLHAKGGRWLTFVRDCLRAAGCGYVDLQRREEWPQGPEQIGLSTLHSSKGLEFDHVVILGLAAEHMPHGPEESDTQMANHRRLVAMAIGRARRTIALTYKPGEESRIFGLLDRGTYVPVDV